jgi:hypothetical protein
MTTENMKHKESWKNKSNNLRALPRGSIIVIENKNNKKSWKYKLTKGAKGIDDISTDTSVTAVFVGIP